jgi:hypothetical protein
VFGRATLLRSQVAEIYSAPSLTNIAFAHGGPRWNGNRDVTQHIGCSLLSCFVQVGVAHVSSRDRFDTQDSIFLSIECLVMGLAAATAEGAVRLQTASTAAYRVRHLKLNFD